MRIRAESMTPAANGLFILFLTLLGAGEGLAQAPVDASSESRGFVENAGQWPAEVAFRSASPGATAWFLRDGWLVAVERAVAAEPQRDLGMVPNPLAARVPAMVQGAAVRLVFEGSNAVEPVAERALPGRYHFLAGAEPVRSYHTSACEQIRWPDLHAGLDLVVRTNPGLFAYDLECAAGADPAHFVVRCEGVERLELAPDGALLMHTAVGVVRQSPPQSWTELPSGRRAPVASRFRLLDPRRFGFEIGMRDASLPLVIDPDLTWSTPFGTPGNEELLGVERDVTGLLTVAGYSDSSLYPTTVGAFQRTHAGARDVIVMRLDPARPPGQEILWSTYLGGSLEDVAFGVALTGSGAVAIAGYTSSSDFPRTIGGPGGGMDAFLSVLAPDGSALLVSRQLGGSGNDWACAVAATSGSEFLAAGYTGSPTFPVTANAYDQTFNGDLDTFVTAIDPGGALSWSTFLGGSSYEGFLWNNWSSAPINIRTLGLDQDERGRILVSGLTWSADFPTNRAWQAQKAGEWDAFIAVLDRSASGTGQLSYATYAGATLSEGAMAAAFGPAGTITIAGYTYSGLFPTTPGAFQTAHQGSRNDAFLLRLDPARTGFAQLVYGTFLGGTEWEAAVALDVDARGFATLSGFCGPMFPTTPGAFRSTFGGNQDGWVAKLDPQGRGAADLVYGTLLGGTNFDFVAALAPDGSGGTAFAGATRSLDFPFTQGGFSGGSDGVVGHLDLLPDSVRRGDGSTLHCRGSTIFEVDRLPLAGQPFAFLVGNAPRGAPGVLVLGPPLGSCQQLLGMRLCVNPVLQLPLATDVQGTAAFAVQTQASWLGIRFHAQPVVLETGSCGGTGPLTSAASLAVTL